MLFVLAHKKKAAYLTSIRILIHSDESFLNNASPPLHLVVLYLVRSSCSLGGADDTVAKEISNTADRRTNVDSYKSMLKPSSIPGPSPPPAAAAAAATAEQYVVLCCGVRWGELGKR